MAEELVKQPTESKIFKFNFENVLETSETITGLTSITQIDLGKITGSSELTITETGYTSKYAQARIAGGTNLEDYKITAIVTTSMNNILELEGILRIRDV